jgi:hypothetical protein
MSDLVQRELDRIGTALRQSDPVPRYDELYVAQQTLMWTLDPDTYKAPYDLLVPVSDTPEDSKGYPGGNDHSESLDISGHRAVSQ